MRGRRPLTDARAIMSRLLPFVTSGLPAPLAKKAGDAAA